MAVAMQVYTSPVKAAERRGTKRTKLFRGRTRTMIRKTLSLLRHLRNADGRESNRAYLHEYIPALVLGEEATPIRTAYQTLVTRLESALNLMTGDE